MRVTKTIKVGIEKKKGIFYCRSNRDVSLVLGTSAATSNSHLYGLKKVKSGQLQNRK